MSDRIYVRHPGEFYYDELQVEAWIKGRTVSDEASNLLGARLMQRKEYRELILSALARKRGISPEELRDGILKGTAEPMTAEEYRQIETEGD